MTHGLFPTSGTRCHAVETAGFAAGLLALVLCATPLKAQTTAPLKSSSPLPGWCAYAQGPLVVVEEKTSPIHYDFSRSQEEMATNGPDLATGRAAGYSSAVRHISGLMTAGFKATSSTKYATRYNIGMAAACVTLAEVRVTLEMAPEIFVATEYPQGSCMFNAVLEHEQSHVAIDSDVLKRYAALLRTNVTQMVNKQPTIGPVASRSVANAKDWYEQSVANTLKRVVSAMMTERHQRQSAIDTAENYAQVSQQCQNTENYGTLTSAPAKNGPTGLSNWGRPEAPSPATATVQR